MKIAFDWQGTLDVHSELREMALSLQQCGWEVVIISAIPADLHNGREEEIKASGIDLPYRIVVASDHYEQGKAKSQVMKEMGITLLVDDTENVVKAVRDSGLKVLQI